MKEKRNLTNVEMQQMALEIVDFITNKFQGENLAQTVAIFFGAIQTVMFYWEKFMVEDEHKKLLRKAIVQNLNKVIEIMGSTMSIDDLTTSLFGEYKND